MWAPPETLTVYLLIFRLYDLENLYSLIVNVLYLEKEGTFGIFSVIHFSNRKNKFCKGMLLKVLHVLFCRCPVCFLIYIVGKRILMLIYTNFPYAQYKMCANGTERKMKKTKKKLNICNKCLKNI